MSNETDSDATEQVEIEPPSPSRWNYLAWLGPVVTLIGFLSYFLFFARFPALRDFPWVNLPMVFVGASLSFIGLARALFNHQRSLLAKLFALVGCVFSVALCALFFVYIFKFSYQIPGPETVAKVEAVAPTFSLLDQDGEVVDQSAFKGKKAVITFYRGWW